MANFSMPVFLMYSRISSEAAVRIADSRPENLANAAALMFIYASSSSARARPRALCSWFLILRMSAWLPVFCGFLLLELRIFVPCVTLLKALLSLALGKIVQKAHFCIFSQCIFSPCVAQKYQKLLNALVGLGLVWFCAFF